jgi:hypothetical protein
MDAAAPIEFSLETYPRSYAAIDRMRLWQYAHLPEPKQECLFHALERFCIARAERIPPRQDFSDYPFLGAGWEWSVFRKDAETVIKVPAGIFPEVNEPAYLANVEHLYTLLGEHFPAAMLAATVFRREEGLNVLEQQYIDGAEVIIIPYALADPWLLQRLATFFEATASLIRAVQWMPDLWLTETPEGFLLRSVLVDRDRDRFALVDFSQYLDPMRMYPGLCTWCYESNTRRVNALLAWSKHRLGECSSP